MYTERTLDEVDLGSRCRLTMAQWSQGCPVGLMEWRLLKIFSGLRNLSGRLDSVLASVVGLSAGLGAVSAPMDSVGFDWRRRSVHANSVEKTDE